VFVGLFCGAIRLFAFSDRASTTAERFSSHPRRRQYRALIEESGDSGSSPSISQSIKPVKTLCPPG
jgi:hypothetical protein